MGLIAGCGGSMTLLSSEETPDWSPWPQPALVGKVEVRQQAGRLQQQLTDVGRLRYSAHDSEGNLVYGPWEDQWQAEVLLEHVPVTAQSLTIEVLSTEDSCVVGRAKLSMVVQDGQTVRLSNPAFEAVPVRFVSLRVSPGSAPLTPGQSTTLRAFGAYGDGKEVELTQRVQWASLSPQRVRVGNTPGQRGRATSLDDRQGDVMVRARFLSDQILVGPLDPGASVSVLDPVEGESQPCSLKLGFRASLTTMDIDGDGREEIAHSEDSLVRCRDAAGLERWSFRPWPVLPGSVLQLSSDDLDGDGREDLVVAGVRADGRAQVTAYDGKSLAEPSPRSLFTLGGLGENFINGINLASGQDGDGTPALLLGAGPERSPEARVYRLVRHQDQLQPVLMRKFLAFDATQRGGVRVALGDIDADGKLEVLTATGKGELPRLRASLLATGQQLWMVNLGNAPTLDGVNIATGQLHGSFGDDIAAIVTYPTPDQKGSIAILDGPSGRKVRVFDASWQRALVSVGHVTSAGLVASANLRITAARPSRLEFSPPSTRLDAGRPQSRLRVQARFSDGQTLDVSDLADFSLESGERQSVLLDRRGMVTGLSRGAVTVRATYAGLTANGTVDSVTEPRLRALSIIPVGGSGEVGSEVSFRALASLEGGSVVDYTDRALWSSGNESVLALLRVGQPGSGLVVGEGSSLVRAVDPGTEVGASMPFEGVSRSDIVRLSVQPNSFLLGRQERQRLRLYAHYEDGSHRLVSSGVRWLSSDPGLSVDGQGEVTSGDRALTGTITGTVQGVDASAAARVQVEVAPPRLVSLAPIPTELTLRPQQSLALRVIGHYDRGQPDSELSGLSYASSDPSVVTVNSQGLVRAGGGVGFAEITITHASGLRSIAPVRVEALSPSLLQLDLRLDSATVIDGACNAVCATGTFSTGPQRELTGVIAWSSSNPSVAVVESTGSVNVLAPGVAVLRGTHHSGVFAEASLSVTEPQLLAVSISPRNPSLLPGEKLAMVLLGSYTDGAVRALAQGSQWASLNPAVFAIGSPYLAAGSAQEPGLATVVASYGQVTTSQTVKVLEP
jgi:hypothetical protein